MEECSEFRHGRLGQEDEIGGRGMLPTQQDGKVVSIAGEDRLAGSVIDISKRYILILSRAFSSRQEAAETTRSELKLREYMRGHGRMIPRHDDGDKLPIDCNEHGMPLLAIVNRTKPTNADQLIVDRI